MTDSNRYAEALRHIPPDDYDVWLKVGMALRHEGLPLAVWEEWSAGSDKYEEGQCARKWASFQESSGGEPVTGGTIMELARQNGFSPTGNGVCYGWDDEIIEPDKDYRIIDSSFIGEERVPPPVRDYDGAGDLCEYLSILFQPDEKVCYCDKLTELEDRGRTKYVPRESVKHRTAGEIIADLRKGGFDCACIKSESDGGAMIRFNPMDGQGEGNSSVTRRSYCLVESDSDTLERQYALYKAMNLPIAVLVHSGNKSLHAIVRVDAENQRQYQERTAFVYEFCEKNGLKIDRNDKNESRYSRMPGIRRGGKLQYIVAVNMGPRSFAEWKDWADSQNDNLPDPVQLADWWDDPPPLKPELISGILRAGHKMLIAGPPKVGKSLIMQSLYFCLMEGLPWLGLFPCMKVPVLYINLEIDPASTMARLKDIASRMGIARPGSNSELWNLRGKNAPLDKLAFSIIRRFKNSGVKAILLDPIYKCMVGDENSAEDMGRFCGYLDYIGSELGASLIYSHHHSKGADNKGYRSFEKSSGSGVFSRDPDAILDLTELKLDEGMKDRFMEYSRPLPFVSEDERKSRLTAWEMSFTLREFAGRPPLRLWLDYPLHVADQWNFLAEAKNGATVMTGRGLGKKQWSAEDWDRNLDDAYSMCGGGHVTLKAMAEYLQKDGVPALKTIKNQLYSRKDKFYVFNCEGETFIRSK